MRTYEERLSPPLLLWLGLWGMALSLGLAFWAALGGLWGLAALLVPGVVLSAALLRTTALVVVEDGHLVAGRARIPVDALGPVQVLDPEQARLIRGPQSDPTAFHLIRGWVPAGVRADVLDRGDPTPYWFVASRRPAELAGAVERARGGRPSAV